jgi:hypothetical protein
MILCNWTIGALKLTDAEVTKKLTSSYPIISRRKVFELGFLGASVFAMGAVQSPPFATASSSARASNNLINTLRSIGKEVCITAAEKLEAAQVLNPPFSLNLRNAGLHVSDAEVLAKALMRFSSGHGQMLRSFSVSYNPLLGDKGTTALAQSLPQTVSEIGFVGCEIGDVGGEALLKWARQAPRLSMICVEENAFSQATERRFRELAKANSELLVVV